MQMNWNPERYDIRKLTPEVELAMRHLFKLYADSRLLDAKHFFEMVVKHDLDYAKAGVLLKHNSHNDKMDYDGFKRVMAALGF